MEYYQHKPEIWTTAYCTRIAKRKHRDAYGTIAHLSGFIPYLQIGTKTYNGGCVREDKWYPGEHFPFPDLPPGFKLVYESTWFWRLINTGE